jgi:hypothetical protein
MINPHDNFQRFIRQMEHAADADAIDFANERSGFILEPVIEPVFIESDPYLGDPIASLKDSDEDMEALIASYHAR